MSAADRLDQIEARAKAADRAGVFESDYPTWAAWEAAWDSSTDVPALVAALRAVLTLADGWQEHAEKVTNVYGKQVVSVEFARAEIVRTIEEALA